MHSENECVINGRVFQWREVDTDKFVALASWKQPTVNILYITSVDSGFEIGIRIDTHQFADEITKRFLGPLLVIGDRFPNDISPIRPGTLLAIRPKIRHITNEMITPDVVERIVQWCCSPHFKPKLCTSWGNESLKKYER
ncbi:hypothetical protein [Calycomorphotria hydatis]|uniref:Uncharacterized protein n=1 Tax=Calycomorphotria hydatis TaxID=2528027 RepID=A0A517TCT3_9PLAN|nr:hypothetical protein [Calycomorphotria hydatis]QDT66189.1 hypothetical protein V22_34540 [Calycomorphotria hydatis]